MATNKTVTVTVLPTLTGDTVASYNVYEGVSGTTLLGTMSVAEAAAGKVFAFTDGIVHSVKVQTVWTTAGASTIRSAGVTLDLATGFSDDFTGTTINTSKWDVIEETANVDISQNDVLILTTDGNQTGSTRATYAQSTTTVVDMSVGTIIEFELGLDFLITPWVVGLIKGGIPSVNDDAVYFFKTTIANSVALLVKEGGAVISNQTESALLNGTTLTKYKLEVTPTEIKFYEERTGVFVQMGTAVANNGTGNYYFVISNVNSTAGASVMNVDNLTIT